MVLQTISTPIELTIATTSHIANSYPQPQNNPYSSASFNLSPFPTPTHFPSSSKTLHQHSDSPTKTPPQSSNNTTPHPPPFSNPPAHCPHIPVCSNTSAQYFLVATKPVGAYISTKSLFALSKKYTVQYTSRLGSVKSLEGEVPMSEQ